MGDDGKGCGQQQRAARPARARLMIQMEVARPQIAEANAKSIRPIVMEV
jgi:hypothetical protein